ncbi:MAG: hypothetical protein K0Q90_4220, partial [Paenibacillaceae bacterium]|nr:hypothetical protein [Paenibacillaceae bacterium]
DQQIRRMKYPNCKSLSEHFEISVRQANRDLEYLKTHMVITAEEKKVLGFLALSAISGWTE